MEDMRREKGKCTYGLLSARRNFDIGVLVLVCVQKRAYKPKPKPKEGRSDTHAGGRGVRDQTVMKNCIVRLDSSSARRNTRLIRV